MANMSRRDAPGVYTIGIYAVRRERGRWKAYGTSWGREELIGEYPTLAAAHLALTGEPMAEPAPRVRKPARQRFRERAERRARRRKIAP